MAKPGQLLGNQNRRTHGMHGHPVYAVWNVMRQRCQNPRNKQFGDYGGRGITIIERWNSFDNFWQDMGPTYQPGLTIDRINNDGPYRPDNCRWVSRTTQARNRRSSRSIETPKGTMLLCEAADLSGIQYSTLLWRIRLGWPVANLFDPLHSRRA